MVHRLFFCFIHIPKCGASSFDEILSRNFKSQYLKLPHQLYEVPISAFNLNLYIQEDENRLGIGGHRISLDIPFSNIYKYQPIAISFIRDPIKRIRSEFFYVKKLPGNVGQKPAIWKYSYSDYLRYLIKDISSFNEIDSYQTNYLIGKSKFNFTNIEKLTEAQKLLLFPLEQFDDACLYLEKKFPDYFSDMSFVKRNLNPTLLSEEEQSLETELSARLVQDIQLCSLANQEFSHLLNSQFTPKELAKARQEFKYRCWRRRCFYDPIQRLTGKVHRLTASW